MLPSHCILRRQIFIMYISVSVSCPAKHVSALLTEWNKHISMFHMLSKCFSYHKFTHALSHMSICYGNLFNFIVVAAHSSIFYAYFDRIAKEKLSLKFNFPLIYIETNFLHSCSENRRQPKMPWKNACKMFALAPSFRPENAIDSSNNFGSQLNVIKL